MPALDHVVDDRHGATLGDSAGGDPHDRGSRHELGGRDAGVALQVRHGSQRPRGGRPSRTRTPRPRPRRRGSRAGGRRRTCSARTRWSWPRPAPPCRPSGRAAAGRGRWRRSTSSAASASGTRRRPGRCRGGSRCRARSRGSAPARRRRARAPKSTISLRWTSLKWITGSPRARAACRTSTALGTASCWPTWSSALSPLVAPAWMSTTIRATCPVARSRAAMGPPRGQGRSRAASTFRWKAAIGASWSRASGPTSNHGDASAAWMRSQAEMSSSMNERAAASRPSASAPGSARTRSSMRRAVGRHGHGGVGDDELGAHRHRHVGEEQVGAEAVAVALGRGGRWGGLPASSPRAPSASRRGS